MKKTIIIITRTILTIVLTVTIILAVWAPRAQAEFWHNLLITEGIIAICFGLFTSSFIITIKNKKKKKTVRVEDLELSQKKEFAVDIVVNTPKEVSLTDFEDQLIKFIEKKGYSMGGGVWELDQEGRPIPINPEL